MKKRVVSWLLVLLMLASLLPTSVLAEMVDTVEQTAMEEPLAADDQPAAGEEQTAEVEPTFESFFTAWKDYATVTNDSTYPFTVDNGRLKSGLVSKSKKTILTVAVQKAAIFSFDYELNGDSYSGMDVVNGTKSLYTSSRWGTGTPAYGSMSGTATVQANAGDTIKISYYRSSSGEEGNCMWLSNFAATRPSQITFHANDGTETTAQQGIFGTGTLQANTFTRDGYRFAGWAETANGAVEYADKGSITIEGDTDLYAVWVKVYTVTFAVTPTDAVFKLYSDAERIKEIAGGTVYTLDDNTTYYYSATLFGYADAEGRVTVNGANEEVTVSLNAKPVVTVDFTFDKEPQSPQLTVAAGERAMTPEADDTYRLPVGYSYSWSFRSANYAKQSGTIDLTSVTAEGARTVAVVLLDKTAWEGEGDVSQPAVTADGTYQITSGSELAWLAQEVNAGRASAASAVLCNDIDLGGEEWTPIGKNGSYAFKGSFDGQGHTVSGLSITGSATSNKGLFGYVDSGTIENVTVRGSISLTGNGSGSYGAGGIAGQLYGQAGAIRNCRSDVTVHGGQNVGGIVGYVAGGYSSTAKEITGCVNTGAVSSTSYNAGGIVGYIYGQVTVDSCYNRGSCTSGSYRAGGITAYLSSSYAAVKNCYTTGETKVGYGTNSYAVIGNKSSGTVENCYYLSGLTADANAAAKTADELKALAPTLGDAFIAAPAALNDGYPILLWQVPTYAVTFTVTDAEGKTVTDAVVTIEGQTGTQDSGKWIFTLPDGTYAYSVRAFGYLDQTGELTVQGSAVDESVTLTAAARRSVTFTVTPADANAAVTVLWNGQTVAPESDGSYSLPYGEYQYLIKAKGYARASGDFAVDESSPADISVELTPSRAWDGTTKEAPDGAGTQTSPYQIESGEQLAWLADTVSAGSGAKIYAVLTDDIDLGGFPFAPIGVSSHEFSGSFDGQGHTVSGLNVSAQYAGLFGVIKDAEIRNVVVQGTVASTSSGSGDAGGIAGRAVGTTNAIENCGNEAAVSGGSNVGGILGNAQNYNTTVTVTGCYNSGSISAGDRAGGILGRYNNSNPRITDCYNTGAVSSSTYAAGILAGSSSSISRCYNAGTVTGKDASKTGAFTTSSYNTLTDCYYLTGSIPAGALDNGANAMTLTEMQSTLLTALGAEKWKQVRGVNQGLPILNWQNATSPAVSAQLAKYTRFSRESYITDDGEESSLPTSLLMWVPVENAQSYTVTLWQAVKTWIPLSEEEKAAYDAAQTAEDKLWLIDDNRIIEHMTAEQRARLAQLDSNIEEVNAALDSGVKHDHDTEQQLRQALSDAYAARAEFVIGLAADNDLGYYDLVLQWTKDIPGVKGDSYDCAADFAALPEGIYYASAAVETDGQTAYVPLAQAESEVATLQNPYNRMKAVTNVRWESGVARWDGRENFTGNYRVDLYTVEGTDADETYTFYRSFTFSGQYTSANFTNVFAAEKKYAFTVTAVADYEIEAEWGLTNGIASAFSDVFDTNAGAEDPDTKEWVDIHSAAEWIALANVEDVPSDGTGSPSRQAVEWGKNYRLADDIDFSTLSAADQVKTKSIGTVNYPFMGEFDGQGHKITGLTLSNSDSGLFWYTGSTAYIHDLTIDSANVLFSDNAAVVAQYNYGRIEKCAVVNTNITADTGAVLGGMVCRNYGIIRDSYVQGGSLTANSETSTGYAGFVGSNEQGALIERCWTSMDVSTKSDIAGGFVGYGYGGVIKNCFALGSVSARNCAGGFVGCTRPMQEDPEYLNCYAAGAVKVADGGYNRGGFVGGSLSWSSFQYDQSIGINNCYYNNANGTDKNCVSGGGRSLDEMKTAAFLAAISGSEVGVWTQDAENNGLPYLTGIKVPETAKTSKITVQLAVVPYDKVAYSFDLAAGKESIIIVTMDSSGNTRLVDVMDEAQRQGLLTYGYATTSTFGRFIHTINGKAVDAPDGWMFTVNDVMSNVSASLAKVEDGAKILWFEGTTENRFQGPTWSEVESGKADSIEWVTISTVEQLIALASSEDDAVLAKHYRLDKELDKELDLSGVSFEGIGSAAHPFTGTFDGEGKTISNVTINKESGKNVGFFNVIQGATIKNLNLKNVDITGETNVGGLVGYARAALDKVDLSKNVANLVGSCSVTGKVTGEACVGGLIGLNEGKTDQDTLFSIASAIDKCTADVAVTGVNGTGGLVGENRGTITKSYANGEVTGEKTTGGLAGDNSGDIYDSHATGAVTGESYTGGFAGYSDGEVKNCYSTGAVSGTNYTGGFAGAISKAENAVSAGQVTIIGTPTQGYNGGFAGQLGGTVSGLANRITVKNVYGNCTQPGGAPLSPVGNANDFQESAEKAALDKMVLTGDEEINDALKKMFLDPEQVMHTVAAANTERATDWWAMDMGAYAKAYPAKGVRLTDEAKQNYINVAITAIQAKGVTDTALDKAILALSANGVDVTKLYPVNSNTPINAVTLLNKAGKSSSAWSAPYTLAAYNQADYAGTNGYEQELVKALLDAQKADGSWDEWGTIDTTANVLAGLAFYADNSKVKAAIDKGVDYLATQLQTGAVYDGGYGTNANSTAMVIIGLTAVGVDPGSDPRFTKDGLTVVEGLMSFAVADGSGFGYTSNVTYDDSATEQAFRALIALAQFRATGKAFNVYDFSTVKTEPSHATGEGETEKPADEPTLGDNITVTVTITTPSGTWLSKSVTVKKGSTVYHAFVKALDGSGITAVGAASGYVRSMTKDGVTYGEFTFGPNSGWLYKVNGSLPSVPLTQKVVADKDYVLWYYTTDWKSDPDAGKMAEEEVTAADVIKLIDAIGTVTKNSGNAIAAARAAYNKLTAEQKALVTNYDKLVAAEAAYAELLKQQAEEDGREEAAAAWRKVYSDVLDGVNADDLAFGSEWLVIALARSGKNVPDSYYDSVVKVVQEAGGELSGKKFTEYSRTILALTAIGKDPADVGGYDLLSKLADMDDVTYQGLNGAIFALIALDSGKYDVPVVGEGENQTTRDGLVAYILGQQLSDGGWALSGNNADPDMTAMALQALAPYRAGDAAVQTAVDKAIRALSDLQQADGGYSSWGTLNSESCAQVLIALAALGIDPATDGHFAKNGLTVLDALLAYALDDGFRHTMEGAVDAMATEQALCALTAYARLLDGRTSLYDMTDALDGQTADMPDDTATTDQQPAKTTPVVVWIALGAVAVGGGAALVATRRRRGK